MCDSYFKKSVTLFVTGKMYKNTKEQTILRSALSFHENYSERPSIENVISRLSSNARLSLSIGESLAVSP